MAVTEIKPQWMEDVYNSYQGDKWIEELLQQIQNSNIDPIEAEQREGKNCAGGQNHNTQPSAQHLTQHMGIIRWKGRVCVGSGNDWRRKIIKELHDSTIGGHSGIIATYQRIKKMFYWPKMKEDIHQFIRNCNNCQINKGEHIATPGLLQPLPVPDEAWTSIGMDFITGLPKSRGKEVIMVVVDRLTKYSHFIALAHPYHASDVAQVFVDYVYKHHGLPQTIITDRDPVFTSRFWQELMSKLEVKLNMSTAYHPQTDGQTERVNQCLEAYLRSMVFDKQKEWSRYLSLAEWWYNTTYHRATKITPFEALYGYPPQQLALGSVPKSQVEAVDAFMKDRQVTLTQLKTNLVKAQERMKQYADKHRSERKFEEGDWVYLKLQAYKQISVAGTGNHKLNPKFFGPFEVLKKIGTCAYRLNLPAGSSIHPVFHVSLLKARVGKDQAISPTLPLIGSPQEGLQVPQTIVARRMVKKRNSAVTQILVQWRGQEIDDATWEEYSEMAKRYPDFILEVEKNFKGECQMSQLNWG